MVVSASLHATEDDIKQIESTLDQRNITSDIINDNIKADIAFHTAIACVTHNSLLINMYGYLE